MFISGLDLKIRKRLEKMINDNGQLKLMIKMLKYTKTLFAYLEIKKNENKER